MQVIETMCQCEVGALLEVMERQGRNTYSLYTEIDCAERNECRAYNVNAIYLYCPPECLDGGKCNGISFEPNEKEIYKLAKSLNMSTKIRYLPDDDGEYVIDVILR